MIALDVNVLVYAMRSDLPEHQSVYAWLESVRADRLPVALFPPVLVGLIRDSLWLASPTTEVGRITDARISEASNGRPLNCSPFAVRRSAFTVRRSPLGVHRSAFTAQRSEIRTRTPSSESRTSNGERRTPSRECNRFRLTTAAITIRS